MINVLSFDVAGVHLPWNMMLAGAVAAAFALVALIALIAPVKMRKALAITTGLLAIGWGVAFDAQSLLNTKSEATQASAVAVRHHQGSCASIQNNMKADEVRKKLGQPDEVRNDEVVRGPGSTTFVYRDLRCAVHLFDDRVELVD